MRRLFALLRPVALLATLVMLGAACGGDEIAATTASPPAVASFAEELFNKRVVGVNPGCVTCHSLQDGITLVGPSLSSVESPLPGVGDADYLRESILSPDSYVAEGFSAGQMPGGWDQYLSDEQIDSLVDFLLGGR